MLATTGVEPDPNPPDLGLAAGLIVRLSAPGYLFLPPHSTVGDKVSYAFGSLSSGHITPPLTEN